MTAGPTREPVDPVRFLANHSSGKQGYAIAEALVRGRRRQPRWSPGPVGLTPPQGVKLKRVTTAREMLAACEAALPADVLVMAAAVADWRPDIAANTKIKKSHRPRRAADQAGGESRTSWPPWRTGRAGRGW